MSKRLPSREQAVELLRKHHCPPNVISHCELTADIALKIAGKLRENGLPIDLELVEAGAVLHDIGRSKSHGVDHGIAGADIALSEGLPESVARIIRSHVGGGITTAEADMFGWPKGVYVPETLEEKVVCYADKLIDGSNRVSIDVEIARLQSRHGEAAERVRRLHEEICGLLGNENDCVNASC